MIEIQTQMSERAVELLNLPEGQSCFLLDVGCVNGASLKNMAHDNNFDVKLNINWLRCTLCLTRRKDNSILCICGERHSGHWSLSVSQVRLWSQWGLPVRGGTLLGWNRHQYSNAGSAWYSVLNKKLELKDIPTNDQYCIILYKRGMRVCSCVVKFCYCVKCLTSLWQMLRWREK